MFYSLKEEAVMLLHLSIQAASLQSGSVKKLTERIETTPTTRPHLHLSSQSNIWSSQAKIGHCHTLPHCRNSGGTPTTPPTSPQDKKSITPAVFTPLCTSAIAIPTVFSEQLRTEAESMDCCLGGQHSVDKPSPLRRPNHAHVVRSFTLPDRIHHSSVDHPQNVLPSSMKIRRNQARRMTAEVGFPSQSLYRAKWD